ncbi:Dyp-type peroxidase domain-containing protein [Sphingomonas sp. SUN039]|uniref:Dyp-type peroxidase domain-containing protein n=1 Tax=Sphingomonas sp. SUN039 TaxID=2937787 RepID=UPI002164AD8C|nr:Dyp-type peroxidase domain-containing protein [Sphingomonas sp. SUN039]UVO54917.1 Dyp-type peroxidase [Sphingomonas sp. SUN039]
MWKLKYPDAIIAAQQADRNRPPAPLELFDFQSMAVRSRIAQRLWRVAFRRVMPAIFALLRTFWPNPRIGRLIIVTREADVREVLRDNIHFPNCYALEMTELGGDQNSVLGMEGAEHEALRAALHGQFKPDDIADIARWTEHHATALLDASDGRIDVMRDLITRCSTEVCCTYLGVTAGDPDTFAEWTMAVSALLFGDPFGDPNTRRQALIAAAHLRAAFDDAIARVEANNVQHPNSSRERATLVDRFITDAHMKPKLARASLIGLTTALIPTVTLACGNILEELIDNPRLMAAAIKAARANDREALKLALLKAARRNPALSPGQWRSVGQDATIAAGSWRARKVRKSDIVLVAVMSALRDGRVPMETDEDIARAAWLMFGDGPHVCLGAEIAMTQMVEIFAVLLRRDGLGTAPDRDGEMMRTGPFPTRLDMVFDDPGTGQSMIIITSPVRDGTALDALIRQLEALGNPAHPQAAETLKATGLVHFASLSAIEAGPDDDTPILLFEINADGGQDRAIGAVAEHAFEWLAPVYAHCNPDGSQPADAAALAGRLRAEARNLHCYPWGSTGLHFNGTEEFSVADVARQEQLADFSRDAIAHFFAGNLGHFTPHLTRSTRAMDALTHVRRFVKQDSFYGLRRGRWRQLFERATPLRYAISRPGRKRLKIADWVAPESIWSPLWPLLWSAAFRPFLVGFIALYAGTVASFIWVHWEMTPPTFLGWLWTVTGALVGSLATIVLATTALVAALIFLLRCHEKHDPVDERAPELGNIRKIAAREDAPGYEQNHIIAVMPFKPGLFRRFVFAFALWGIKQSIAFWFRPGFVVTMGTIHKAKWLRVPETNQFVFLSNYDGTWESYLEDFITRAHQGQSAAWGNGVGFPRTRYLINEGAADGDRFKRWVRRQQRPTAFWYSRFPHLTTKQIRNNALIEDGLARAANDTDAQRWLTCFGSAQREDGELESHETQSIVFTGFGKLEYSTSLLVRLPADSGKRQAWLEALSGIVFTTPDAFVGLPKRWEYDQGAENRRPESRTTKAAQSGTEVQYRLPAEARIAFGDRPVERGGAVLGLTAAGLRRCGIDPRTGFDAFPAAFAMGMAARTRVLGDGGSAAWLWNDGEQDERAVDAVITIYGSEIDVPGASPAPPADAHRQLVDSHRLMLEIFGGHIIHAVPCTPVSTPEHPAEERREHFGFRDGISQPVIRGSLRSAVRPAPRDLIAPGEFLLGYRNDQGYFPPPIVVGAEQDVRNDLPTVSAVESNRFPRYGANSSAAEARDLGRNGSFMVLRQLDQNVRGFRQSLDDHAHDLAKRYPELAGVTGANIDGDWVGAKLVGRWPNGAPLVGNPTGPCHVAANEAPDNDFTYGVDDPRGLQCPLGAHIRRANPRDSLEPGDASEQQITNRHRLLRRGRSYAYRPDAGEEKKGLLFMALCADIERQFEFVQHTWLNATSFHGLKDEPDPLLGNPRGSKGKLTVPVAPGPIQIDGIASYVSLRAGGYFFLPSRAAIQFLISLAARR